jgi:hypothetical protein
LNVRAAGLTAPDLTVAADAGAPPCLIVNPRSFSASRGFAQQASALARTHGAEIVTVDGPAALRAAVESILARRQRTVMVLAGDGTVCAIVDQLSNLAPGAWTPDLLILPGGRTNLTAVDLGTGSQSPADIEAGAVDGRGISAATSLSKNAARCASSSRQLLLATDSSSRLH